MRYVKTIELSSHKDGFTLRYCGQVAQSGYTVTSQADFRWRWYGSLNAGARLRALIFRKSHLSKSVGKRK